MQFRKLYVGGKKIYFLRQKFFIESKTDVARQALNLVSGELGGMPAPFTCEFFQWLTKPYLSFVMEKLEIITLIKKAP